MPSGSRRKKPALGGGVDADFRFDALGPDGGFRGFNFLLGLQLKADVVHAGGTGLGQGNYREVSSAEGAGEYGVGAVIRRVRHLQPGHVLVEVDQARVILGHDYSVTHLPAGDHGAGLRDEFGVVGVFRVRGAFGVVGSPFYGQDFGVAVLPDFSPILRGVGVELVVVALGVEEVDAVGDLVVGGAVNRQPRLEGPFVGLKEDSFVFHFPAEVVEAGRHASLLRNQRGPVTRLSGLPGDLDQGDVVVGAAVAEEDGLDGGLTEDLSQPAYIGVELRRALQLTHEQVGVAQASGAEHYVLVGHLKSSSRYTQFPDCSL